MTTLSVYSLLAFSEHAACASDKSPRPRRRGKALQRFLSSDQAGLSRLTSAPGRRRSASQLVYLLPAREVALPVFSVGGVIQRGEKILDVVSDPDWLTIEAQIAVEDISDIRPNMRAGAIDRSALLFLCLLGLFLRHDFFDGFFCFLDDRFRRFNDTSCNRLPRFLGHSIFPYRLEFFADFFFAVFALFCTVFLADFFFVFLLAVFLGSFRGVVFADLPPALLGVFFPAFFDPDVLEAFFATAFREAVLTPVADFLAFLTTFATA